MMVTSDFARVSGARLYFEIQGSGQTVVLLGCDTDSELANQQFDDLAKFCQVIRYDMRGRGKSSPIDELPFSHSQDLLELLDHLSIRTATLAEITPDSSIAKAFATMFPERVSAIVLMKDLLPITHGSGPSPR
ncbi:MAG TPA: alpha/beta hydrolase [Candidatus Kapabacteria bacterium]|nr:alpha/beta hydrolase [Candidatus Kapabacteria bacterium]